MKKELTFVLNYALSRGFQIHPDAFEFLEKVDVKKLERIIKEIVREKAKQRLFQINQDDLETHLGIKDEQDIVCEYEVVSDPTSKITMGEGVEGYNALFSSRFKKLKQIIANRPESKMLKPIAFVRGAKVPKSATAAKIAKMSKSAASVKGAEADYTYVCGLVTDKDISRNFTKLILEDPSGLIEGLIFDKDLQEKADMLLADQFVMARVGVGKNSSIAIKELILPDIPDRSTGRSESEVFALFLSDLHIGSKYFMEEEFSELVSWLSSPDPVARRVRFVLIGGDVVDGVGIYKDQDKELVCQTLEEQLEKVGELLGKIPDNVKIFIMPGNHDPGRRALPQPAIPKKYNQSLWEKENVIMVGNPAMVSLNGVKVLMFHGQSIDDIVKTTPGLSYDNPVDVMKYLLRARHLSPIYGSQTPIAPEEEDLLVIDEVPDIFHVGHVHKAQIDQYKGILLLNSGSWQEQTPFQKSKGMMPNPGIAILVNLKTFKILHENYNTKLDNVL